MKAVDNLRKMSNQTRSLLVGNGQRNVEKLEEKFSHMFDDLEALDRATWKVMREGRTRLYQYLSVFGTGSSKESKKTFTEWRHAWDTFARSAKQFGDELQHTVRRTRTTKRVT